MELKLGYKLTEVGMIPEDWKVRVLGDIAIYVASGKSKPESTSGTYPVYGSTGIIGYSTRGDYSGDAILIARVGANAGKLNYATSSYGVTDNTIIIRLATDQHLPYFRYQLQSKRLNSLVFGTGQPLITGTQLKRLAICIPPLPEQRAIAAALSDVDALISALDELIAKKRAIKQGTMQQLLTGRMRLLGFGGEWEGQGAGYKQTEVGVIPEDWEVRAISEIAEVRGGKRLPLGKSLTDSETPYPYIRVTDMFFGGVSLEDIKYVPEDVFPAIKNYRISSADIFISVAGTLGIVGKVPLELDGANLTENADKITNISCDRDYLLYHLLSPRIQNIIEQTRTVGAQPKLALARIKDFLIPFPGKREEQRAIAEVLSDMDAEIAALETRRDKTRLLKQGMMQELLTGKTRLV